MNDWNDKWAEEFDKLEAAVERIAKVLPAKSEELTKLLGKAESNAQRVETLAQETEQAFDAVAAALDRATTAALDTERHRDDAAAVKLALDKVLGHTNNELKRLKEVAGVVEEGKARLKEALQGVEANRKEFERHSAAAAVEVARLREVAPRVEEQCREGEALVVGLRARAAEVESLYRDQVRFDQQVERLVTTQMTALISQRDRRLRLMWVSLMAATIAVLVVFVVTKFRS